MITPYNMLQHKLLSNRSIIKILVSMKLYVKMLILHSVMLVQQLI
jgi:hypothetical protein